MNKRLAIGLVPLLVTVALAGTPAASEAAGPHYYSNLVKLGTNTSPNRFLYVAYGDLAINVPGRAPTECEYAVAGWIENPTTEGPGKEETEVFSPHRCVNTECKTEGGTLEVRAENENAPGAALQLQWPGELTEIKSGTIRLKSTNIRLSVDCQGAINPPTLVCVSGAVMEPQEPRETSGASPGKPAKTKFGGTEGGKLECGAALGEMTGILMVVAYNPESDEPVGLQFKKE